MNQPNSFVHHHHDYHNNDVVKERKLQKKDSIKKISFTYFDVELIFQGTVCVPSLTT